MGTAGFQTGVFLNLSVIMDEIVWQWRLNPDDWACRKSRDVERFFGDRNLNGRRYGFFFTYTKGGSLREKLLIF